LHKKIDKDFRKEDAAVIMKDEKKERGDEAVGRRRTRVKTFSSETAGRRNAGNRREGESAGYSAQGDAVQGLQKEGKKRHERENEFLKTKANGACRRGETQPPGGKPGAKDGANGGLGGQDGKKKKGRGEG